MILRADDPVDCELAWSRDARNWQRVCPGEPFIPRGPKGTYDYGCIFAAAYPIVQGDDIRVYYLGNDDTHHAWRGGYLCLAHLPLDRFAGMRADGDRPAIIETVPLTIDAPTLELNLDASQGECAVEILDENADPIPGFTQSDAVPHRNCDGLRLPATWRNANLSQLRGRPIRLRFHLRNAALYAIHHPASPE